jgi:Protein NO VEIN, C-terminal
MYARQTDERQIQDRIVRDVSPERFRAITESALEGLARKELNLSAIVGRSAEAKERRLVPEVVEQFFVEAAPETGLRPRPTSKDSHTYRIGKIPRNLVTVGDQQEHRFGRLGREYATVAFAKTMIAKDPTLEWVTPGHPLFEAVRSDVLTRTENQLRRGAVFYDLNRSKPGLLDVFAASIKDGRGNTLHRRLFAVETDAAGQMTVREPTVLHEIVPAPVGTPVPNDGPCVPHRQAVEQFLYQRTLQPWVDEAAADRLQEVERIVKHVEISLNALIDRQQVQLGDLLNRQVEGQTTQGLDGQISQSEQHLDNLNNRLDLRRRELELERHCAVADIKHLGRAWVLPHPERNNPQIAPMVRDDEIERIAVEAAIAHERARGWEVESVESENRGFDLISRRPHPADPKTFIEVRFIEVKGRAGVGAVALTKHEYDTAVRLTKDYWLYAVFNCAGTPQLHDLQDPARLGWKPVVMVEHYQLAAEAIIGGKQAT